MYFILEILSDIYKNKIREDELCKRQKASLRIYSFYIDLISHSLPFMFLFKNYKRYQDMF